MLAFAFIMLTEAWTLQLKKFENQSLYNYY